MQCEKSTQLGSFPTLGSTEFSLMISKILITIIEIFKNSFVSLSRSFHLKYGLLQMSLLNGILGQFSINPIMKKI
ncbi:hypothetical protein Goklo_007320 [Gossypium klotzschianum]|uniref:Uncharacterized protein n=1 Tax=Gossypium klotzschianum TaxID=34286 RepID=A0A7J8WCH0_9ROSI|nr:hypothetical protein [Gossypium klotzschianum]